MKRLRKPEFYYEVEERNQYGRPVTIACRKYEPLREEKAATKKLSKKEQTDRRQSWIKDQRYLERLYTMPRHLEDATRGRESCGDQLLSVLERFHSNEENKALVYPAEFNKEHPEREIALGIRDNAGGGLDIAFENWKNEKDGKIITKSSTTPSRQQSTGDSSLQICYVVTPSRSCGMIYVCIILAAMFFLLAAFPELQAWLVWRLPPGFVLETFISYLSAKPLLQKDNKASVMNHMAQSSCSDFAITM